MDIDLLSKMVKELILDNDRVVLPGLGSFVAEIVPSTFSDKGYTINPPYRRLFFRSKPDEGDMLVRFYAESNNVDVEIAERIIKDFLEELKNVLHTKKTVVFPGLGRLRATKENNVFFVADEDLDIYPAGFGLEPISLKTHEETPEEVAAAVQGLKEIIEEPVVEAVDEPIDIALEDDIVPAEWTEEIPQEPVDPAAPSDPADPALPAEPDAPIEPADPAVPAEPDAPIEPAEQAEPVDTVEDEPVVEQPAEKEELVELVVETETEAESLPDLEVRSEPMQVPVSLAEQEHEPEVIPEPEVAAVPEKPKAPLSNRILLGVVIALASIVALFIIYIVVMRLFPDFLNGLLYSPEELEIINFK